ncbi:MAG: hypothetical protein K1X28_09060 [Parachlamydiales bacterium]|nr:hypothetical protein [Parachlamydiales bacterium]
MTYDSSLRALLEQQHATSILCRPITEKYCDKKEKLPQNGAIGFTPRQYEAAKKALELAIELAAYIETQEQREECRLEISVSRISLKLMREDLIRAKHTPDEKAYEKVDALAQAVISTLK